ASPPFLRKEDLNTKNSYIISLMCHNTQVKLKSIKRGSFNLDPAVTCGVQVSVSAPEFKGRILDNPELDALR
ncbi:MAG TPA: hypothetical protein PLQ82_06970, partial [Desulfobacteraceae bacterium]|nr:hypothetical protein [Desulfobacteraceae bacterium]